MISTHFPSEVVRELLRDVVDAGGVEFELVHDVDRAGEDDGLEPAAPDEERRVRQAADLAGLVPLPEVDGRASRVRVFGEDTTRSRELTEEVDVRVVTSNVERL